MLYLFLLLLSLLLVRVSEVGSGRCEETPPCDDSLITRCRISCEEQAAQFLSAAVPGFHLLCVLASNETTLHLLVYEKAAERKLLYAPANFVAFRETLAQALGLDIVGPYPKSKYKWEMFRYYGPNSMLASPLSSNSELIDAKEQVLFLFQGGRFIWPGVRVGFRHQLSLPEVGFLDLVTISLRPLIFSISDVVTHKEMRHIITKSRSLMKSSYDVILEKSQSGNGFTDLPDHKFRTGSQVFLDSGNDEVLTRFDEKISALARLPVRSQEDLQVLRYDVGQFYEAHHDYFDPSFYQKEQGELGIDGGRNNRLATALCYFSNVESGGETIFPRYGDYAGSVNKTSCSFGFKVTPEKGKIILFYNMLPTGQFDHFSLHGACAVKKGRKWAANKWIWTEKS